MRIALSAGKKTPASCKGRGGWRTRRKVLDGSSVESDTRRPSKVLRGLRPPGANCGLSAHSPAVEMLRYSPSSLPARDHDPFAGPVMDGGRPAIFGEGDIRRHRQNEALLERHDACRRRLEQFPPIWNHSRHPIAVRGRKSESHPEKGRASARRANRMGARVEQIGVTSA